MGRSSQLLWHICLGVLNLVPISLESICCDFHFLCHTTGVCCCSKGVCGFIIFLGRNSHFSHVSLPLKIPQLLPTSSILSIHRSCITVFTSLTDWTCILTFTCLFVVNCIFYLYILCKLHLLPSHYLLAKQNSEPLHSFCLLFCML